MDRRFECKRSPDSEVIRGEIGLAVADPDIINQHLRQPTTISVLTTQVGNGKLAAHVLLALPSGTSIRTWDNLCRRNFDAMR